ncbi:Nre family DNA repair protein [Archaeoglobus neptunius]|uniref:Nre family DNA repair protein n=1 Tax=Archaeoglobus neptunius TaxID=2798580 RepID=UPI001926EC6B|nr:Nre family DNA repair protein [Archaeoglobus neptunius]
MVRCAECKGNLLCGRSKCPLVEKYRFLKNIRIDRRILDPSPPSIFVGRVGYPRVYVGPLIAIDSDPVYADAPWLWNDMEEVIRIRTSLLRASTRMRVEDVRSESRQVVELQEMTAAIRPVDVEAEIKKLSRKAEFDDVIQPVGYSAVVERLRIAENPKIPDRVEKVYYDELRAHEGLFDLYNHGFSTYYLQKIFSAGMLGNRQNRKLVPTRWSITAVHSILGEQIKREIADLDAISDTRLFSFEHFGNHFEVILYPGRYFFQLVEIWQRKSFWSPKEDWVGVDSEDIRVKKDYSPLGGGYYAARLPVLEYLRRKRRQASVLIIREIKPSYYAPLGVWVVEEGVRKALNSNPEVFDSFSEAFERAASRIECDRRKWSHHVFRQTSLSSFF